ncbi:MAG: hypothetical protein L6R38_003877 [Xanthoria sp. 2 TBL-2021]|nr:MAG: hypothetical protein L6R38_003877 [Xanthoria sp. 2 TBL-2021]
MSEIKYPPLISSRHIRLLRIIAAAVEDQTTCYELITVNLDETPAYVALSYTWGNPLSPDVQGAEHWPNHISQLVLKDGKSIHIGQNLFTALKSFHEMGICGDIWIDAICINQKDVEERNAQVAIMGDIYASAENVIVWLGEQDWNSQVAMVFLEKFMPKLRNLQAREKVGDESFSYSFSDPRLYDRIGEPVIPQEIFDGLASFLERAWFKRAWTFQEVVLARRIEAVCGTTYIEWEQLETLLAFLETSDWDMRLSRFQNSSKIQQIPGRMILSTIVYRRHIAHGDPHEPIQRVFLERIAAGQCPNDLLVAELDGLSYSMRCRKATDRRDHVFALFGIANRFCERMEIANPLPAPDYQQSFEEAYTRYARCVLQTSKTLLLLSNVEDRPNESSSALPSWVPDFSKEWHIGFPLTGSGAYYDACPQSSPRILPNHNPKTLVIQAYHFDTVTALGESDFELGTGEIPFTQSAKILLDLPLKYHTGQDRVDVLWRTLIADQANKQCPAPFEIGEAFQDITPFEALARLAASTPEAARALPSLSEIVDRKDIYAELQRFRTLDASEEGIPPSQIEHANKLLQSTLAAEAKALPFARQLGTMFITKRIVTTSRGFVGAALLSTTVGHEVFIMPGGRVPFVLQAKPDGTYQLMGEVYVHGIMRGEAFEHGEPVVREVILS